MVVQITKFNGTIDAGAFHVYPAAHFAKLQKNADDVNKKAAAAL